MINQNSGAATELRRCYDALCELAVGDNSASQQALEEYRDLYVKTFQSYNRGQLQYAELMARAIKHLCRAAWFDAKIKYLESHAEDLPHLPCTAESKRAIDQSVDEIKSRLSRMRLTGLSDRFGARARKHVERLSAISDSGTLLAETFLRAAHEYCLATEVLREIDLRNAA